MLIDKKVYMLDMFAMVATKYRGQFEERIKSVMKEVEGPVMLFCLLMKFIQ